MLSYQHAAYIRESIDSILEQDYPNLRIVIGDDASTDGTQDILRDYAARYPGLFTLLLAEKNQGITRNANQVFRACDGEFLAHTSGDDAWLPGKLHKQVTWMADNPDAVMCYTNAEHIDAQGKRIRLHHESRRNPFREGGMDVFLQSILFFPACSVMVRRTAAPSYGFDERLPWNSDWLYLAEIAHKGRTGYIPETLARYRVHGESAMRNVDAVLADAIRACDILGAKYPEHRLQIERLRGEFIEGSALQHLKAGRSGRAASLLREAYAVNPHGDSYLNAPAKAALAFLSRTELLEPVYRLYAALTAPGRSFRL